MLELRVQKGEISEEELARTETELMERLAAVWSRRPQV
jgi:hypothetical protein